jgi:dTDP-4-amino-4,6-dideoxygalactose transaminase
VAFEKLFEFESAIAEYTGAPYAVVTDGCTHALELCFRYKRIKYCQFPAHTYLSIPQMLNQLGVHYRLTNEEWIGEYHFYDTNIWDSARRLERGMYRPGTLQCLSFGHSKPLNLGKCGAILLDDPVAYQVFSRMRSDGRDLSITPWQDQKTFDPGYHYCPTIETCELGIKKLFYVNEPPKYHQYPDLRTIDFS